MEHFSFEGGHYEMGVRRGKIFRNNKVTFPLHLDIFQREHGEKSEKILRDIFPEVCEEIRGASEGAGISYRELASWLLCMGCCMYNLEENIPLKSEAVRPLPARKTAPLFTEGTTICLPA